jgi:hypothetical protein
MLEHRVESDQTSRSVRKGLITVTSCCSLRISGVSGATHSSRLL